MNELPIYGPNELAPGETREPENVNGRFRIKCPDGKQRLYTRTTTFIDCLEDKSVLEKWKQRVILVGLDADPSLILEVAKTDPEDKDAMNKIAERAFEAGDGYLKSRKGTDLHRLTYLWDTGQAMPEMSPEDEADVKSYAEATQRYGLVPVARERRVVIDDLKVTGTPDAVWEYRCLDGKTRNVIGDIKTGRVDYGQGKMAQQTALYSWGEWYTDDGSPTGLREPMPDVSRDVALILELPQGGAINGVPAQLYEVDLRVGWYGVNLSKEVRRWRNFSKTAFTPVP